MSSYHCGPISLCSFHTASGTDGKHYWDFSVEFGPVFTDKDGRELQKQPRPGSAAWKAFELWHVELKAERAALRRGEER